MWVIPEDLGNFSPKKEKNLGEQKFTSFGVKFLRILKMKCCELLSEKAGLQVKFELEDKKDKTKRN
jgi:hypothetical protein